MSSSDQDAEGGPSLALIAAILLGLAAVLTSWGSFRAAAAGDEKATGYAEQQLMVTSANDIYAQADQASSLEQQFFLSFAIAAAEGNEGVTAYLEQTMSEELYAAVDWWLQQPPESVAISPFVPENPAYAALPSQLLIAEGNAVMLEADAIRAAADESGAAGDRFELANVFFAVVLFLAGIASVLARRGLQLGILVLGAVLLVAGVAILVTTPGWASIS